jgi:hypothetical protein
MALFWAVKTSAGMGTINCLLADARVPKSSTQLIYGSAALRQAIRYQNLGLIDKLCGVVDINAIERSTKEYLEDKYVTSPNGRGDSDG